MTKTNTASAAASRTALRAALRASPGIVDYLKAQGLPLSAVSILPMAQLREAAAALGIDAASFTDAAPAPAPVETAPAMQSAAALAPVAETAEAADLTDALQSVRAVVLPSILAPLENAVAAMADRLTDAEARAAAAEARAAATSPAAVVAFPSVAPALPVAPVAPALPVAKRKGEQAASSVFGLRGGRLANIQTSLWDAIDAPSVDPDYIWQREAVEAAIGPLNRGRNVFLAGPAGTGKTSFAMQFAARTGRPFIRIAFDTYTEPYELVGQYVREWKDGVLTAAMRRPGTVVLLDEPSRARSIDGVLQTVLDHGFIQLKETGERVEKAEGVVFIVADNTFGRGDESGLYTGTAPMNHAALDRFAAFIKLDYLEPKAEAAALAKRVPGLPENAAMMLADFASVTRNKASNGELTAGLSFRRLTAFCEASFLDKRNAKAAFQDCILNAVASEDAAMLSELFRGLMGEGAAFQALLDGKPQDAATNEATTQAATMPENRAAQAAFANS